MSNGKVRIYELSRELNLENKDILAVCAQLKIPVKSHSSTITESDAEQISKYIDTHPVPSYAAATGSSVSTESASHQSVKDDKKQQILEIRKPKNQSSQNHSSQNGQKKDQPVSAQTVTPPNPPAQPTPPVKPSIKPPVPPQVQTPTQPESAVEESEVDSTAKMMTPPEAKLNQAPAKPQEKNTEIEMAPAPKLSGPPPRPTPTAPSVPTTPSVPAPVAKEKPVLKPNKPVAKPGESVKPKAKTTEQPAQNNKKKRSKPIELKSADPSSNDKEKEPKKRREIIVSKSRDKDKDVTVTKQKTLPELQAPPPRLQKSSKTNEDLDLVDETEEEGAAIVEDVEIELKRPKRPPIPKKAQSVRPGKRDKWEEEEEDPAEAAKKAAKLKAKRPRKPIIDDDDDDEFNLFNSGGADAAAVSLSLERPARAKAETSSDKAPRSGGAKPKKPAPVKGGSSRDSNASQRKTAAKQKPQRPEILIVTGSMTVQELANALEIPETDIIRRLFSQGIAVNITETLDFETISMICEELEVLVETQQEKPAAEKSENMLEEADLEHLQTRPPVVTIMGHVDHGKTTLLDAIRETKVAQAEAGGITQHIGAYHVDVEHEGKTQQVVFLDTPGHEAFTAMRARGTRVTDIAILVVAADDGVRPQTIEAISHAKAANVPLVVAINKIDKEQAQPDRVKQELMEHGLVPEEWGGDTIMVPVSAIQQENLNSLLEMILLVSEVENLEANPDRSAKGTIIEAHLDKARGPVASLLVQNGTLRVGDIVVAGSALGKVRAMVDDRGERVEAAGPSFAVEVLGLRDVPAAGDEFDVFENEREAAALADSRAQAIRQTRIMQGGRVSLSALSARVQEGELKELNIILKADVQGSVEAIINALKKLPQKEVQLQVLLSAPGEVTETDVDLAAASDAVLIGFNTTLAQGVRQAADQVGVDIREYNIIYNLLDDVQAAMEGLLEPELVEEPLGQAEVRAVFPVGRSQVAGCYIQSGKVIRNCKMRVHRKNNLVFQGGVDSLKRMKEDAKEVAAGYECGIGADNFSNWAEGDIIEAYRMTTKRRTLSV
ncbi:MAG: translation initiation factor IF-2 [Microcoleaceae cyanobacterium]